MKRKGKEFSRFENERERERAKEKARDVRRKADSAKWENGFKAGGYGGCSEKENFS